MTPSELGRGLMRVPFRRTMRMGSDSIGPRSRVARGTAGFVLLIAGCGDGAAESTESATSGSPTPSPTPIYQAYDELVAGDCFDPIVDSDSEFLLAGEMRACDESHLMEAFGTSVLDDPLGESYPGDGALFKRSEDECLSIFEEYVGVHYDDSRLDAFIYNPSAESWAFGDRRILCLVEATEAAPLTRSVRSSEQ